jgi:hypothetical protein
MLTNQKRAKYKLQHSRLILIDREINTGRYPNCGKLAKDYSPFRSITELVVFRDPERLSLNLSPDIPILHNWYEK